MSGRLCAEGVCKRSGTVKLLKSSREREEGVAWHRCTPLCQCQAAQLRVCRRGIESVPDASCHGALDFPMFEWNEDEGRLEALHHPFTAPNQDDLASGDLASARALAYDLVYNGAEVAGACAWLKPLCCCTSVLVRGWQQL